MSAPEANASAVPVNITERTEGPVFKRFSVMASAFSVSVERVFLCEGRENRTTNIEPIVSSAIGADSVSGLNILAQKLNDIFSRGPW